MNLLKTFEMIFVSCGGLNNLEKQMLTFIKGHPEIYALTEEGKRPRKFLKETRWGESWSEEKTEGFTIREVLDAGAFSDVGACFQRLAHFLHQFPPSEPIVEKA